MLDLQRFVAEEPSPTIGASQISALGKQGFEGRLHQPIKLGSGYPANPKLAKEVAGAVANALKQTLAQVGVERSSIYAKDSLSGTGTDITVKAGKPPSSDSQIATSVLSVANERAPTSDTNLLRSSDAVSRSTNSVQGRTSAVKSRNRVVCSQLSSVLLTFELWCS